MAPYNGTSNRWQICGHISDETVCLLFVGAVLCMTPSVYQRRATRGVFEIIDRGLEITDAAMDEA